MERKSNKILIFLALVFYSITSYCEGDNNDLEGYRCFFKNSFIVGQTNGWHTKIIEMEREKDQSIYWYIEALNARYGLIGELISDKNKSTAKALVLETDRILDDLIKRYPDESKLYCIKAGLYGFKIGLAPYKAILFGPESSKKIEKAYALNPDEPLVWLERGNADFYRPEAFGGNKEKALRCFRKSAILFEKENGCNWLKYFSRVMVYNCLMELDKKDEANQLKKELISETGGFDWLQKDENHL